MPPKKKPRLSSRAPSTPSVETPRETIQVIEAKGSPTRGEETLSEFERDPWTDEQEISLFKGLIRWKPVGMHKHFRMISLSQYLRSHGHSPLSDAHTGISGIWKKLDSLYNLKVLDERENSLGELDPDPRKELFLPFKLPEDEYGEQMFEKRLAGQGSSSPPSLPHQLSGEHRDGTRRASTIEDTEEPRSSPAPIRGLKSTRGGARGKRKSQLSKESTPRGGRRGSKASIATSSKGEDLEEDDEDDEQAGGDEEAENEDEEAPPSVSRGSKRGRGRGNWKRGRNIGRRGGRRKRG